MEQTKRVEWIDICKAIAIYFMVLCHVGVRKETSIFVHAFHMPIFFILSGLCFNEMKNSSVIKFTKKRLKTLIVPYFIFGIGLFLLWDLVLYILNRPNEMRSINVLLENIFCYNTKTNAFGVIQWFLTCLFFTEVLFCGVCKITKGSVKKIAIITVAFSVIAYLFPKFINLRLPLSLDCTLMAVVFYSIGWMMRKLPIDKCVLFIQKHKVSCLIITIILGIVLSPLVFLNGDVNMRTIIYGNYFLFIFNATVYSLIIMVISIIINKKGNISKILQWIGKNTLVVLLLNSITIRAWQLISPILLNNVKDTKLYIINSFVAMVVLAICLAESKIINKFFPILLGKK